MKRIYISKQFARANAAAVIENALRDLAREAEAPDTCIHLGINWRALTPNRKTGRLHATCPGCQSKVSRSAFVN